MSKFRSNLFPIRNHLREISRVPTSSSRDIDTSILMMDPIERIVSTGTFQEINRLTPQQKVTHLPEIVRRFDLVMPNRDVFKHSVDMWREIVKQYSYKHLSEVVPVQSNLMTPAAYFIQSAQNADITAFEKFDLDKLNFETITLAVERLLLEPLSPDRYNIALKLLPYMDNEELIILIDYASKIGDLINFDSISNQPGRDDFSVFVYKQINFLTRDGHTQKVIDLFQSEIERAVWHFKNHPVTLEEIYGENFHFDEGSPEIELVDALDLIGELRVDLDPLILEIVEKTEKLILLYTHHEKIGISIAEIEDMENFLQRITDEDMMTIKYPRSYRYTVGYIERVRYIVNFLKDKVMNIMKDDEFHMELNDILFSSASAAVIYNNLDFFQEVWSQHRLLDDEFDYKQFMDHSLHFSKPPISQILIDDGYFKSDEILNSEVYQAMMIDDFESFTILLERYINSASQNNRDDFDLDIRSLVGKSLEKDDIRFLEHLDNIESINVAVRKYIHEFSNKSMSFSAVRYIKNELRYNESQLSMNQAVNMVPDTDIVKVINFFDDINQQGDSTFLFILESYLNSGRYKPKPEILRAILATPFLNKQLGNRSSDISHLINTLPLDKDIIKILLNSTSDFVIVSSQIFGEAILDKGDRDFYIYLLELVKQGKIRITKDDLPEMIQISVKLEKYGFIEMADLIQTIMRSGTTAKL